MLKSIVNYNCRYLPDTKQQMFVLMKRKKVSPDPIESKRSYYTIPFYNKHSHDTSNSLVAVQCEVVAKYMLQDIGCDAGYEVYITQHSVKDIMDYAAMLKLPMVVILSMYCSLDCDSPGGTFFEIFYNDRRAKYHYPED